MTSLLPHTVAQPTKWRFLPKNSSQLVIFVIGLAFTWVWGDKNHQHLIFKVNFLCQKSVLIFWYLFYYHWIYSKGKLLLEFDLSLKDYKASIDSAEINNTSYEIPADFSGGGTSLFLNWKLVNCDLIKADFFSHQCSKM